MSLRYLSICCAGFALLLLAPHFAWPQDQFVFYFGGGTAQVGSVGGATFDANGDFWLAGRDSFDANISKLSFNGTNWVRDERVFNLDWKFFYRSDDIPGGITHPGWGGPQFGTPASFLLNPAPLTIDVLTGSGATVPITYQPGELAFLTDQQGSIGPSGGAERPDAVKRVYRYDLRKIDNPTTDEPDYDTAGNGSIVFGDFNNADWNDVFVVVASQEDVHQASGTLGGSDNWGRRFSWSSDGQSIYAVDGGSVHGGIYKINASTSGDVTLLRADRTNVPNGGPDRIQSESAIVNTSVFDFNPADSAVGDQIVVEGSADGGNNGGLNVYLDRGPGLTTPQPLFTEAEFRSFAEYPQYTTGLPNSYPEYPSLVADDSGNLYFYEQTTDGLYRYDTQGRFVKIASEAEHNEFQVQQTGEELRRVSDIMSDLQVRTSSEAGFPLTEIVYVDDAIDAPVGILIYQVGDFDRDNDIDQTDMNLFGAALGVRGEGAEQADWKFDLNGNPISEFDADDDLRYELVTNGPAVVDWKDVKVLQQFIDLPNGDANFDGLLDFTDIDIVEANYYTLGGSADKVWTNGDFASADPDYFFDAPDANLVNEIDLSVLAESWVIALGQSPITATDADNQGYTGQFRTDLLAAFAALDGLPGDYNGDNVVDAADYTVWRNSLSQTGPGLPADGNGDQVVNQADYHLWRENYGASASLGSTAQAAPEPTAFLLLLMTVMTGVQFRKRSSRIHWV